MCSRAYFIGSATFFCLDFFFQASLELPKSGKKDQKSAGQEAHSAVAPGENTGRDGECYAQIISDQVC